jgi:hypothetical protein
MIAAGIGPREQLHKNFVNLKGQLQTLDESIESIIKGASEVLLLASHPVYQYFSRRYQLNVRSVLWEPDTLPNETMWKELEEMKREHPAAWMIWEDEPLPKSVERLEKMGIQSVVFNPCGNRPDEGDFMTVMKSNIENLRSISTRTSLLIVLTIVVMAVLAMFTACASSPHRTEVPATGFLSDYSGLRPISETSYRYINPKYDFATMQSLLLTLLKRLINSPDDMAGDLHFLWQSDQPNARTITKHPWPFLDLWLHRRPSRTPFLR